METLWCLLDNSQCWWRQGLVLTQKQTSRSHTYSYRNAWKYLSLSGPNTHAHAIKYTLSLTTTSVPRLTQTPHFTDYWQTLFLADEGFASMCKETSIFQIILKATLVSGSQLFPAWLNDRVSDLPTCLRHHIFFNKQGRKVEGFTKCSAVRYWSINIQELQLLILIHALTDCSIRMGLYLFSL